MVTGPWEIQGVVTPGLVLEKIGGQEGCVGKNHEIVPGGQSEQIALKGDPKRLVELPHQERHLAAIVANHRHLACLVGGDNQRTARLRQPADKVRPGCALNAQLLADPGGVTHTVAVLPRQGHVAVIGVRTASGHVPNREWVTRACSHPCRTGRRASGSPLLIVPASSAESRPATPLHVIGRELYLP